MSEHSDGGGQISAKSRRSPNLTQARSRRIRDFPTQVGEPRVGWVMTGSLSQETREAAAGVLPQCQIAWKAEARKGPAPMAPSFFLS